MRVSMAAAEFVMWLFGSFAAGVVVTTVVVNLWGRRRRYW